MDSIALNKLKTKLRIKWKQLLKPPPKLKLSEWADKYRRLSAESSAEPGRWVTARAEFQRGIMDALSDPLIEDVVFKKSAQVGATEILNNIVGYFIHQDPSPILTIQPTEKMGEAWSKDRLAPMLRDTPALKDKVKPPRSRDTTNTLLHKVFPGGHITIAGANAPSGLASRPIRIVLCDEIDRYPASAGTEGDPVRLAEKRANNFWNRKKFKASTPTEEGVSRIDKEFNLSDQRYFHVPCGHCGHKQRLRWSGVKWTQDAEGNHDLDSVGYACEECGSLWTEAERIAAIRKGEWIATKPGRRVVGFHISELYSPWSTLRDVVESFLESKDDPELLKTWTNTVLGETWELRGQKMDHKGLYSRREDYTEVPEEALILTVGIDVQHDRIEYEVVAWGEGEQNWNIDYRIIEGDTSADDVWDELDDNLDDTYTHASGAQMHINAGVIDSGDRTQRVYDWVRTTRHARMYAGKGMSGEGRPVAKLSRRQKGKSKRAVDLYQIGVDDAKGTIYARLRMENVGPGYSHFPMERDLEYFEQLTAEKRVTKLVKGFEVAEWILLRKRNEALDCRVYAYAALKILNPSWQTAERRLGKAPPKRNQKPQHQHETPKRANRQGRRGIGNEDWSGRL